MKKWILFIVIMLALATAGIYFFIPNIISLKASKTIAATRSGLHRILQDKENLAKWWPGKISNDSFYFNGLAYRFNNGNVTVMPVSVRGTEKNIISSLYLVELSTDSTQLNWVSSMASSYNPIKRLQSYRFAKSVEKDMDLLLGKMETFYKDPQHIYGFDIKKELVKDSLLIATNATSLGYPSNSFIYGLITKLNTYAALNHANQSGYPMLNIITTDSIEYDVKVALPLDKALPGSGDILQKRMLGRGNILVTEVKGGMSVCNKAFSEIKKYADDYKRVPPAIPFFSLITDRLTEPDSSKWITKIYFPVM